ncbi:glycosyltransferase family 2 protein [Echinicola vietnamensis]|uniref:Glycosyl transferase n=1 Tax=Echinicola vietnamensis (strain DSM 17526 / LMG 23754 / KMM 6221) TaxID=926556 RepID=L0G6G2_ECHVK|nr:glycosyltransferase family 2 protein [Echinicola vietnamensis]AGA80576.1 glycosyl transferase [Echinicola vietnamensis DSM 17526]
MKVSIITPLFNGENFISETIESVISQTYTDWEMIIVDDGSQDKGPEIVKSFAKNDKRINFFRNEENCGPAISRNKAIEMANGRFIAFLDSDDRWTSQKLEKQISFMHNEDIPFSYTCYKMVNENGKYLGEKIPPIKVDYKKMLESNYIGCLTAVYDSHKVGKVYMPNILKRQDYGLWLNLLKKVKYAYCINEVLAEYTIRSSSVSSNKIKLIRYNWELFRNVEKLSFTRSVYYLCKNILNKFRK